MRWRDWRGVRPVRRCRCGRTFEPDLRGQRSCRVCCQAEADAERAELRVAPPEPVAQCDVTLSDPPKVARATPPRPRRRKRPPLPAPRSGRVLVRLPLRRAA
jgi:hypothetical protein